MTHNTRLMQHKGPLHVESHFNRVAFATIPTLSNEQTLLTLININPMLSDQNLKTMVLQKASKLIAYYKHGLNDEGEDISKGCLSLTDGELDDQEMQATLTIINSTFKYMGISLSLSDLPYQWPTSRVLED